MLSHHGPSQFPRRAIGMRSCFLSSLEIKALKANSKQRMEDLNPGDLTTLSPLHQEHLATTIQRFVLPGMATSLYPWTNSVDPSSPSTKNREPGRRRKMRVNTLKDLRRRSGPLKTNITASTTRRVYLPMDRLRRPRRRSHTMQMGRKLWRFPRQSRSPSGVPRAGYGTRTTRVVASARLCDPCSCLLVWFSFLVSGFTVFAFGLPCTSHLSLISDSLHSSSTTTTLPLSGGLRSMSSPPPSHRPRIPLSLCHPWLILTSV